MLTWVVQRPGALASAPLRRIERDVPVPSATQVLVKVSCCGVCRTDLHLTSGELSPRRTGVALGHEVVGVVQDRGSGAQRFAVGDRVGVPWLASTEGACAHCRRGSENLCVAPTFTGWDVDGGYADFCLVEEAFAYRIPVGLADESAAPLLCAGIIGYRSLLRTRALPGQVLGIYGFGGSAHLTAQVALHLGMRVHVMTRGEHNRALARQLGVDSVTEAQGLPPEPLDAAILFAPAGDLVPVAMRALAPGGTLAVAGIWLSDIPSLSYDTELFREKSLCSVTANTRADGEQFLALAERFGIKATTTAYPMSQAPRALDDLEQGRFGGAAVLHN